MAISRDKKVKILEKVKKAITGSQSVVFVNFQGLNVAKANELRRKLQDNNISYTVVKKSLIKKALDSSELSGVRPELGGEIALAYGEDLLAPAKGIYDFSKEVSQLKIVGGIFEGGYMDKEAMTDIAQIPSREGLYGQLLYMMMWPVQGLAVTIDAIAEEKAKSVQA